MLIAIDVGWRCSGCVSGVSGAVDRGLLSGQARDSSAFDMIAKLRCEPGAANAARSRAGTAYRRRRGSEMRWSCD